MAEVADITGCDGKKKEVLQIANQIYSKNPAWVSFFREVLGVEGAMRRLFTSQEEITDFELSPEYREIQQMVAKLRERGGDFEGDKEPTRVITVHLPKSLHEFLRNEAHDRHTSMNQLCISKLLQVIEDEMVPSDNRSTEKKPREAGAINRLPKFQPADAPQGNGSTTIGSIPTSERIPSSSANSDTIGNQYNG